MSAPKVTSRGAPGEVVLDFSQVRPYEPLDPTIRYLVRVTKLDTGLASGGGPKSHCELTIEAPEEVQTEEWVPDESADGGMVRVGLLSDKEGNPVMIRARGRILFREFSLQPQALPFLYEFLKAVDPSVELGRDFRYNPKNYVGLTATCTVQNEAFEEQIRARVRRMYPAGSYKV